LQACFSGVQCPVKEQQGQGQGRQRPKKEKKRGKKGDGDAMCLPACFFCDFLRFSSSIFWNFLEVFVSCLFLIEFCAFLNKGSPKTPQNEKKTCQTLFTKK
jgi:hypothetical protein